MTTSEQIKFMMGHRYKVHWVQTRQIRENIWEAIKALKMSDHPIQAERE